MKNVVIQGFIPAVVTPFNAAGDIQFNDYSKMIKWLLSIGANGICVAGDNGESWAVTPDERQKLLEVAKEAVDGRVPVILGASAPTSAMSSKYAKIAAEGGADAILLMPQTYVLKASREEMLGHFKRVADAADVPVVAYNSPRRAGVSLTVDDIEAICEVAPVIGIKESTRDVHHLTHLIHRLGQRISVMTGPCPFLLLGAALGAKGFIATGPELLGPVAARIMDIGRAAPNEEYRQVHFALTRLYEVLMGLGTWPASFKAALELVGQPAGVPREPVLPLSGGDLEKLRTALVELNIL
ncbi:dihydrodipicolinate synthase family protein [Pseudomonas azerbaijanoccidentalis]|jgi:4-hydroxy-tetrahydrodipicolinate synthase